MEKQIERLIEIDNSLCENMYYFGNNTMDKPVPNSHVPPEQATSQSCSIHTAPHYDHQSQLTQATADLQANSMGYCDTSVPVPDGENRQNKDIKLSMPTEEGRYHSVNTDTHQNFFPRCQLSQSLSQPPYNTVIELVLRQLDSLPSINSVVEREITGSQNLFYDTATISVC